MNKTMHIRIEGSGHPHSWRITDADTGAVIQVTDLQIHVTPQSSEVVIKVLAPSIDVTAVAAVEETELKKRNEK